MTVQVLFHELLVLEGEIRLVTKAELRSALDRLKSDPECGKPLHRALQGCRSIRVHGSENRLVYEVISPRGADPVVIRVLSIERRRDSEAYDLAAARR